VAQKTPDAGISKFWYDRLGRLVVSQNAKQKTTNRYSYTLYDDLGRITEVGEKPQSAEITQTITRNQTSLHNWLTGNGAATNVVNKEQITRTRYDLSYDEGSNILGGSPSILVQRNLRNRVSYTMVFNTEPNPANTTPTHTAATYYSYDIHGNVDTLLQDLRLPMLALSPTSNRYKKLVYNYDLISGKVNKVSYQPGMLDAFYHKYLYDAENRLTDVYTSHDNLIWEKDARYSYYKHGPMARTILGQQQVQGVDYAYTLQGWLKGVNSTAVQRHNTVTGNGEDCGPESAVQNLAVNARLSPFSPQYIAGTSITFNPGFETLNPADDFTAYIDNTLANCGDGTAGTEVPAPLGNMFDMGTDGVPTANGIANQVSNDVYGYSLNYFTGDYKPINGNVTPFANVSTPLPGSTTGLSLYNGNISSMAVNIPKLGQAQLYGYRYDQLNRIVAMDAFTGLDGASNTWAPVAIQKYKERVTYDPNGNILTYKRNGNAARLVMDDMTYTYKPGTNQLDKVVDAATDASDADYPNYNDIKRKQPDGSLGQANGNYQYDEIGNLVSDASEGITNINWSVYGKILSITKANGTTINYTYDASGNRISKVVVPPSGGGGGTTIYVRDASGNVMSVYTADPAVSAGNLIQTEVHLYGSSRLGIFEVNHNVQTLVAGDYANNINTFTRGNKFFELSNHLGNVLVTISDRKVATDANADGLVDYYSADVITANDYYPFGMLMAGRKYTATTMAKYRYSINGQEKETELNENITTAQYWEYDSRTGRRWNVDPIIKENESGYFCFSGNPIALVDKFGLSAVDPVPKEKSTKSNPKTLDGMVVTGYTKNYRKKLTPYLKTYYENRSWDNTIKLTEDLANGMLDWALDKLKIEKPEKPKSPGDILIERLKKLGGKEYKDLADIVETISKNIGGGSAEEQITAIKKLLFSRMGIIGKAAEYLDRVFYGEFQSNIVFQNNLLSINGLENMIDTKNFEDFIDINLTSKNSNFFKDDHFRIMAVTNSQFHQIMKNGYVIPSDYKQQNQIFGLGGLPDDHPSIKFVSKMYFNGQRPRYYIYYNDAALKGYLRKGEFGVFPIK
jgi:YD repeat-containing protein